MADQVFIQHRFSIIKPDGSEYADAIVLPQDQYDLLSDKDIETIKQDRLNGHLQQLADAQIAANKTDGTEVIAQDIANVDQQIQDLTNYKQARQVQLDSISLNLAAIPIIEEK